jgi:tetratricopeptide (TPR) repeat protein
MNKDLTISPKADPILLSPIHSKNEKSVHRAPNKVRYCGFKRLPQRNNLPRYSSATSRPESDISALLASSIKRLRVGDNAKALEISLNALNLSEEKNVSKSTQINLYRIAARACLHLGKRKAAEGFYAQAIQQLQQDGKNSNIILSRTLQEYAYLLYREKGYWRALECARRSLHLLQIEEELNLESEIRSCLFLNAKIAKCLFLYPSAYQYLIASWNILLSEKKSWQAEHQNTLIEIAETLACLGQHHSARILYRRLIMILLQCKQLAPKTLLRALKGLAECSSSLGQVEEAERVAYVAELISIDCFGAKSIEALRAQAYRSCTCIRLGRGVWGIRRLYKTAQAAETLGGDALLLSADILDFLADLKSHKPKSALQINALTLAPKVRTAYAEYQGARY